MFRQKTGGRCISAKLDGGYRFAQPALCLLNANADISIRGESAGYTLVELLIVLMILAFAAAMVPAMFTSSRAGLEGKAFVQRLEGGLRAARSAAVYRSRKASLAYDASSNEFRFDAPEETLAVPKRLTVEITTPGAPAGGADPIVFYPDGSSNGGEIKIAAKARAWRIHVGFNGRISTEEPN